MAGPSNKMTDLINKIEGRLGLRNIPMPDGYGKDNWANKIIIPDTLTTFSRYFQRRISYHVDETTNFKNGWYYIDEKTLGPDAEILGIIDIDWATVANRISTSGYGTIDPWAMMDQFTPLSLGLAQVTADYNSLFDSGVYLESEDTNKFRLKSTIDQDLKGLFREFNIFITIKHSPSLVTIAPTKMEIFEKLAMSDVATYLYNDLKFYDGLETSYATLALHLDDLANIASRRDDIVEELDNSYVSAANPSQPCFIVQ